LGWVRKKGPGVWQATADLGRHPLTGQRQRRAKNCSSEREAKRWIRETEGLKDQGLQLDASRITVETYLASWLPAYCASHADNTARNVRHHANRYILPKIGRVRLRDLTPQILMALYAEIPPLTMRQAVHVTINHFLGDALRAGLLNRNPASQVVTPKLPEPAPAVWWSADELRAFLEAAGSDRWFPLWRLLSLTGLRRGEAVALQWHDLDLSKAKLSVRMNMSNYGMGRPKTRTSRRTIDLDGQTVDILHRHWREQRAWQAAAGREGWEGDDFVFTHKDGRHLYPEHVSQRFQQIVQKHGLRRIKLHELRDTHGSLLVQNGVHLKVVQERLGHSSPRITLERYAHIMPSMGVEAAQLAGDLVQSPKESPKPATRQPRSDPAG
jgi:integrase